MDDENLFEKIDALFEVRLGAAAAGVGGSKTFQKGSCSAGWVLGEIDSIFEGDLPSRGLMVCWVGDFFGLKYCSFFSRGQL